jgi:dienelactone hydrolase
MRSALRALIVLSVLSTACSDLEPLTEPTREVIKIETLDLPGSLWDPLFPPPEDGEPVEIEAQLSIPPTDEPVPLVIMVHGCGGAGGAERGWVDDLNEQGYAALLVDSLGGRETSGICVGEGQLNVASPIVDLFRAAEAMAEHPYIDASRMAVMGFSFGGRTAIWSSLNRVRDLYGGSEFAAHIAFYPSTCFIQLEDETEVSDSPIRIFHGTADDWTPIDQCEEYAARMTEEGRDVAVFAYEGAHHGFDDETTSQGISLYPTAVSPRNCTFVERDGEIVDANTGRPASVRSACVERGIHFGWNGPAHAASKVDLTELLDEVFS